MGPAIITVVGGIRFSSPRTEDVPRSSEKPGFPPRPVINTRMNFIHGELRFFFHGPGLAPDRLVRPPARSLGSAGLRSPVAGPRQGLRVRAALLVRGPGAPARGGPAARRGLRPGQDPPV